MDKKYQDIHLVDDKDNVLFVIRQVQIESIDMNNNCMIVIWIKPYSLEPGIWNPSTAPIYLPKMKGCKLIID